MEKSNRNIASSIEKSSRVRGYEDVARAAREFKELLMPEWPVLKLSSALRVLSSSLHAVIFLRLGSIKAKRAYLQGFGGKS